jgi:hypothetical protein
MEPAAAHGFGDRAGNITDAAGEAEPHRERRVAGRPYRTVNGASGTRGVGSSARPLSLPARCAQHSLVIRSTGDGSPQRPRHGWLRGVALAGGP